MTAKRFTCFSKPILESQNSCSPIIYSSIQFNKKYYNMDRYCSISACITLVYKISKFKHDRLKFELDQTQVRPPKLNFEPPSKSLQRLSIPMFGQKQTIRTHAQIGKKPNSKPLSIFAYQNKTK